MKGREKREDKVYKKARSLKGLCEVCGYWVRRGEFFITSGTDGHGALTGLRHKDCDKEIEAQGKGD